MDGWLLLLGQSQNAHTKFLFMSDTSFYGSAGAESACFGQAAEMVH